MAYSFERIEKEFLSLTWQDRYKYIIRLAKDLPALDEKFRVKENLVKGCQSQVWLWCELKDNKLNFVADSDALIVKGLIVIALSVYNNKEPTKILNTSNDFVEKLGLSKYLTQTRTGGLIAIIKQIKFYALAYLAKSP